MLNVLLPLVGSVLDKVLPDEKAQSEAKQRLAELAIKGQLQEIELRVKETLAKADVIKTEAASSHWLAANWRPILMLVFGGLIVARWFGWSAPNLSESEYLALWDIVELGVGGYVIGRSVEKVAPSVASVFKKN